MMIQSQIDIQKYYNFVSTATIFLIYSIQNVNKSCQYGPDLIDPLSTNGRAYTWEIAKSVVFFLKITWKAT